jgi:hypothetical protein
MEIPAWIALFGVIGTWLIFVAAIWGERIRSWLFKPTLQIELVSPIGERTTEKIIWIESGQRRERERPARYYYLSVTNPRRWPVANNVQIVITRLETPDPSGRPQIAWEGEVPFQWQHPQLYPLSRIVGPAARANFIVVADDTEEPRKQLHLMLLVEPNNFKRSYYKETLLWLTVIARSNETDSFQHRFEIAWNGEWNPGDTEMSRHLKILDMTATAPSSGAKPRWSWRRWTGA